MERGRWMEGEREGEREMEGERGREDEEEKDDVAGEGVGGRGHTGEERLDHIIIYAPVVRNRSHDSRGPFGVSGIPPFSRQSPRDP